MILAILNSRTYVPNDTIAIEFADIDFNGEFRVTSVLNHLKCAIAYQRYDKQQAKIDCINAKIEENSKDIETLKTLISNFKKPLRFTLFNKTIRNKIKMYKNQIEEIAFENSQLIETINALEEEKSYPASFLKDKLQYMLISLGFSLYSSHHQNDANVDSELYQFDGNEKELIKQANQMFNKFFFIAIKLIKFTINIRIVLMMRRI